MKVSNMKQSRYISKADLPEPPLGMTLTIDSVQQENVASPDQAQELKFTIKFMELPKSFVMNITNAESIASILQNDETDMWRGGKVEMYYEPNIMMGPKKVGGIRIRPSNQSQAVAGQQHPVTQGQPFNDDIPL